MPETDQPTILTEIALQKIHDVLAQMCAQNELIIRLLTALYEEKVE